ncbi:UNVERIFIED_CONTAM: hypothetical protein FKN15_042720 [Acipenser sinensis]
MGQSSSSYSTVAAAKKAKAKSSEKAASKEATAGERMKFRRITSEDRRDDRFDRDITKNKELPETASDEINTSTPDEIGIKLSKTDLSGDVDSRREDSSGIAWENTAGSQNASGGIDNNGQPGILNCGDSLKSSVGDSDSVITTPENSNNTTTTSNSTGETSADSQRDCSSVSECGDHERKVLEQNMENKLNFLQPGAGMKALRGAADTNSEEPKTDLSGDVDSRREDSSGIAWENTAGSQNASGGIDNNGQPGILNCGDSLKSSVGDSDSVITTPENSNNTTTTSNSTGETSADSQRDCSSVSECGDHERKVLEQNMENKLNFLEPGAGVEALRGAADTNSEEPKVNNKLQRSLRLDGDYGESSRNIISPVLEPFKSGQEQNNSTRPSVSENAADASIQSKGCPVNSSNDADDALRSPENGDSPNADPDFQFGVTDQICKVPERLSFPGTIPRLIVTREPSPCREEGFGGGGDVSDSHPDVESPCSDSGCGGSPSPSLLLRKFSSSSSAGLSSASSFEESEDDFTGSDIEPNSLSLQNRLGSPDDTTGDGSVPLPCAAAGVLIQNSGRLGWQHHTLTAQYSKPGYKKTHLTCQMRLQCTVKLSPEES